MTSCSQPPVSPPQVQAAESESASGEASRSPNDPSMPALPESPAPGFRASDTPVSEAPGQTATATLDDVAIVTGIRRELDLVAGVAQHRVEVASAEGNVWITGSVASATARTTVLKRAAQVAGVKSTVSELEVVPEETSDQRIVEEVEQRLNEGARASQLVRVSSKGGVVKLSGSLPTHADRVRAREAAEVVPGVRVVDNAIVLTQVLPAPDDDIAADAVHRLSDERRLRGAQLAVRVSGGTVFLSGEVKSDFERRLAREVVWTPSVHAVYDDELRVVRGREHLRERPATRPVAAKPRPLDATALPRAPVLAEGSKE
jgi:osmotically-inducible protein OsmY